MTYLSEALGSQGSRGKTLTNPASTGFGSALSADTPFFDTQINPKPLPTFPSLDYLPTDSSALNDVPITSKNLRFSERPKDNQEVAALLHQTQVSGLHGYRTPRLTLQSFPEVKKFPETQTVHRINPEAYFRNMSSAEYGFRKLDYNVYNRVSKGGTGARGNSSYMRADGRERDANRSIYNQQPHGLSFDSEPAKPHLHSVAPNHQAVAPVLSAAPTF